MARYKVIATPKGLWPYRVIDTDDNNFSVASLNSRKDADAEAKRRNELASA